MSAPAGRVAVRLAIASVAVNLVVGGNLLMALGIPYATEGGALPFKLHPGTYLAAMAAVAALGRAPLLRLRLCWREAPAVFWFLAAMAGCVAFALLATGRSHLVVFIENFMPAGLLALVLRGAGPRDLRRLALLALGLLALNVLVALAETLLQRHFVPVFIDDRPAVEHAQDFRAAALFDHPLTGAMLTMSGTFLAASPGLSPRLRWPLLGWFGLGLLAFGGRTAIGLTVLLFALWQGSALAGRCWRRRLAHTDLGVLAVGLFVLPPALALVLTQTTIGARLIAHFYWDDSAQVRSVQWQVLDWMQPGEVLFGMTLQRQEQILHQLGLGFPIGVIENFWLLLFLYLGVAGFALFLSGLLPFLAWVMRRASTPGRLMLLALLLAASTSNSLGRKSGLLTVVVPLALASPAVGGRRARGAAAHRALAPALRLAAPRLNTSWRTGAP